jgi:solute:Na+ symporter, SSS family
MVLAALLTYVLDTARAGFELLLSIGAGTGLLYLLRWFWWRINAWSEIAAMLTSFAMASFFFFAARRGVGYPAHVGLLWTVGVTTAVWLAVTYLAPASDRATLVRFYALVRPAGPGGRQSAPRRASAPPPTA